MRLGAGEQAGTMWVDWRLKKPGNNEKQTARKKPPGVITKERGRAVGDREGVGAALSLISPEGLRFDTELAKAQKSSCWASRRRN